MVQDCRTLSYYLVHYQSAITIPKEKKKSPKDWREVRDPELKLIIIEEEQHNMWRG